MISVFLQISNHNIENKNIHVKGYHLKIIHLNWPTSSAPVKDNIPI